MPDNWSREEVEATVSDYLDMLAKELRGEDFNKAEHNRNLQVFLTNRSKGAVERKHQNISALMIELGYPYIDGYKPLGNYQDLLSEIVGERLVGANRLHQAAAAAVERPIERFPIINDVLAIQVEPPHREDDNGRLYETVSPIRKQTRKNYLEIESRNTTLGLAGEKLVLEFEHKRLWQAGKKDLANRIEHVSKTTGDHLGFDISSFETDGRDRLIEVKTTRFGAMTPFFASRNEVDVSEAREREFQLYRLFQFTRHPKLFVLPGSLCNTCLLDPMQFSALPR
ncbi:MAG: DUF3883 domain-containing protein [Verrucomicrobiota bacterium]|jgi:hypothetical protein